MVYIHENVDQAEYLFLQQGIAFRISRALLPHIVQIQISNLQQQHRFNVIMDQFLISITAASLTALNAIFG